MVSRYAAGAVLVAAGFAYAAESDALSAPELRGRAIYRTGSPLSGQRVTAILSGGTEIAASLVPCAGCHGLDGRGRPEAGVIPPNIRWEELTRAYGLSTANGRRRTAYDEHLAVRAFTMGIDSAGNRLDAAMPHFEMARADAEDLLAYLKKLSTDRDPGVADSSVRVGVLLASDDALAGQGAAIRRALSAYFKDWNGRGGVYGRSVELVFGQLPPEPAKAAAFAEFLSREPVFALMSSFIAGAETEIVTLLGQQKIPLIGARTLLPPAADNPTVFFLDSGLPGQVEALAGYALQNYAADSSRPVVIASDDALSLAGVSALRAKLANTRWANPEQVSAPHDAAASDELTRRLAAKQVRVAFPLMRAAGLRLLIDSSRRMGWKPTFLIPGALSTADATALRSAPGPVILAYPFSPLDISQDAQAEWNRMASSHLVETRPMATQLTALCEARILVEGLKRAGRDLSRERLLESLDGLYDFPCGFKQPVSFGSGRRFGMEQVHVVVLAPGNR